MATRNLVPRNSGEGGVGRLNKAWATGVFDNLYFGGLLVSMDQNVRTSDNVEFNSGNFLSGLTLDGVDVSKLGTSLQQTISGSAEFLFISDVSDNDGVTDKIFYEGVNPNLQLSGITVASAKNLKVELRWDGPNDEYMGDAYINGQQIPLSNIEELGEHTRRFKGYLDNFNAEGLNFITGEANDRKTLISLNELGAGPEAINLSIDSIQNATPKAGELLGSTHLKQGDEINIYADFNTSDVSSIKILNSGLSQGSNFSNYNLVNHGGFYRATIPTIVSSRVGVHGVAVQAVNGFGSTGDAIRSDSFSNNSGTRDLDQTYPNISSSDPTSYNGRSDGLRESESVSFYNNISNWNSSIDFMEYETLSSDISISNLNTFEQNKTVSYLNGIYNNSDNVKIYAYRTGNGATDEDFVKVKIANGPVITGSELSKQASSAASPNQIGTSEVKAGDVVDSKIFIDGNGVSINDISISVLSQGLSNGSQTSYSSSYSKSTLADGSFEFLVPIDVYGALGNSSRDGEQAVTFKARNNFGTISDTATTTGTAEINNGTIPVISINSITYPASQQAIKSSESTSISNNVTNFDSITYSSPNSQLSISNTSTYEQNKNADYLAGGYNVEGDGGVNNLKISATKSSNGATTESFKIVNIANSPLTLSINNLASSLSSSPNGVSDQFYMSSSQLMLSNPTLSTDSNQINPSSLNQNSSGTGKNSNSYTITVSDLDTKGTFNWQVSATNLANITTTSISSNPTYKLAGFSSRTISASPNSLGAGLADIGTTVSNPNNLIFENISEGGSAPNGGTAYTYQSYSDGVQLNNTYDLNNKFAVCNSSGVTDSDGNYVFNLDKLNRSANTSTLNPASFVISE